jgi:hypothetical protein
VKVPFAVVKETSAHAKDETLQQKLWEFTEKLITGGLLHYQTFQHKQATSLHTNPGFSSWIIESYLHTSTYHTYNDNKAGLQRIHIYTLLFATVLSDCLAHRSHVVTAFQAMPGNSLPGTVL